MVSLVLFYELHMGEVEGTFNFRFIKNLFVLSRLYVPYIIKQIAPLPDRNGKTRLVKKTVRR